MQDLRDFFEEEHFIESRTVGSYQPMQIGANIRCATAKGFDWDAAAVVLVGCGEWRGEDVNLTYYNTADDVRRELYSLYYWHPDVVLADAGNIKCGNSLEDTRAALLIVLSEIYNAGKIAVVIGGSHDLTLQQYEVFKKEGKNTVAVVADMLIDLDEQETITSKSFLMDMLTGVPNFVTNYSHIAFQSYYAHPKMLETLDKLRFDFFRLGRVREDIADMEPVLRRANLLSIDMNVVRYSDAMGVLNGSPNGLPGEELCQLVRYAGMSSELNSLGIYGFDSRNDQSNMTSRLVAQMLWYFIDGYLVRISEAPLTSQEDYLLFTVTTTDGIIPFLKSRRSNRWWMTLPDGSKVPCSYADYQVAGNNGLPERWLREQERLV